MGISWATLTSVQTPNYWAQQQPLPREKCWTEIPSWVDGPWAWSLRATPWKYGPTCQCLRRQVGPDSTLLPFQTQRHTVHGLPMVATPMPALAPATSDAPPFRYQILALATVRSGWLAAVPSRPPVHGCPAAAVPCARAARRRGRPAASRPNGISWGPGQLLASPSSCRIRDRFD